MGGWSLSLSFLLPCPPLIPLLGRRSISLWPSISQHLMVSDTYCKVSAYAWGGWELIGVFSDRDVSDFKIDRPQHTHTNKRAAGQTQGRVLYPPGYCFSRRTDVLNAMSIKIITYQLSGWSEINGVKSSTCQSLCNLITVFVSLITVVQSVWEVSTQKCSLWITDIRRIKYGE